MRSIGMVWVVVGVLAIIGGIVGTVAAVVIFGALAAVLGAGIVALQNLRAKSAVRASRTLTNAPAPPGDPPTTVPGPPRWVSGGPTPGPPTGSDPSEGSRTVGGGDAEAEVGSPGESTDDQGGQDSQDDGQDDDAVVVEDEPSNSEEDDGTGPHADDDRSSGERGR
ncbi:MAG: hypothetical protein AVDCRST_MAG54-3416 [uncultured Actinomycetospora sp.]|uniref:Uncharacterized protein n=1 Tax=uncultured Actinomycetospora sp. TaxID=1135996 RepID=A0A6J4JER5_9PSEU|nr:MAG: hypothetical protein AVDCRST_MAG54-3416 [uncultured Actinomycetospora sp.]